MTPVETPSQLATRFERGEIDRAEFQRLMAVHAREIIAEIEQDHLNPLAAWIERRRCLASLKKLLRHHSAFRIREILVALSAATDFPPARLLWNAAHPDVPLHCFFRIRRKPVFQILSIRSKSGSVELHLETGESGNRHRIHLVRDANWKLAVSQIS